MWLDKRRRYRPAFHLRYGSLGPVPCSAAALPGTAKRPYSAVRSLPQISGQRTRVDAAPGRSNLNMRPNSASARRHSIHEPTRKPHPPNIDRRSRRLASSRRSMCTHQSLERRRGASGMDRLALAGCHADQDIPIVGQADRGGVSKSPKLFGINAGLPSTRRATALFGGTKIDSYNHDSPARRRNRGRWRYRR